LVKKSYISWKRDNVNWHGAALAYYTIFSLPPLLVIVIAIAGFVFGEDAARGRIVQEVQGLVGVQGAKAVQYMVLKASQPKAGTIATIIGIVLLALGATGALGQMQSSLNMIWNVKRETGGSFKEKVFYILRKKILSFALVVGMGFLLLVSLVVSALITAFSDELDRLFPGPFLVSYVVRAVDLVVSFGVVTVLFAMIFKVLPDAEVAWGDVWIGAAVTSALFTAGKHLIGLYLGSGAAVSVYGAAGSIALLLIWIYYSSQILFFGAEFTRIYANTCGSKLGSGSEA